VEVHVALGSNVGDRLGRLREAVRALEALGRVTARSSVWETEAVDSPAGAGDFLNAVVALETTLSPAALLAALHAIERRAGRAREGEPRNAPRTLDLDLLLAGDRILDEGGLELPHPRLHLRSFVLAPLAEIAPAAVHPILHRSIGALLDALPAGGPAVARLPDPL
jgi:2-amino-4-hydroxy-6-hydroxymethyldihydropteridine diphosphokinase